jgi:hypothetical protein
MFSSNYYFLVAGLPELTLEQGKLVFGTDRLREDLREGLSAADYKTFENLLLVYDNQNLLHLLGMMPEKSPVDGVFSYALMAEEMKEPRSLRPYMMRFIESYRAETRLYPQLSPVNEFTLHFYNEMLALKNDFLKQWFEFELNLRNVLLVLSGKRNGISVENQVIPANELAEIMRRSNARDLGISSEWGWAEKVIQIAEIPNLMQREKATDILRWQYLDELNTFNYFSTEVLLAFYIKLGMIERWLKLDKSTGEELFRQLIGDLQNSYEFPNEFSIKDGRK